MIEKKCREELRCYDCSASEGGYKHGTAFLMWLYRKIENPSLREKTIAIEKPSLATASTPEKLLQLETLVRKRFLTFTSDGRAIQIFSGIYCFQIFLFIVFYFRPFCKISLNTKYNLTKRSIN